MCTYHTYIRSLKKQFRFVITESVTEDENRRKEKWGKAIKEIARQNKALRAFNEQEKQKIQKHSAKAEM